MGHPLLRLFLVLLLLGATAGGSSADHSKLDPLARAALARLRAGSGPKQMLKNRMAVSPEGELDVFIRGPVSRAELESAGAKVRTALPGLYTAFVPVSAVEAVAALKGVRTIRGAAPVELELDASVPSTGVSALRGAGPNFAGPNGAGVLIGDVDSGVDYDHGDFKDDAGHTRFVRIWDQPDTAVAHVPPDGFSYGAEWTSAEIDANQSTEVDIDGHGTHVMGIAGGDGSQTAGSVPAYTYAGMAPRADLVMVKTNFSTSGVVDGVKYIFDLATQRGQKAVVNLSLGSQAGPHDGTSDFEAALSGMTGPGRIIVKSAGNDRGTTRHAEVFAAGAGSDATMNVTVSSAGGFFAIDGYYESSENLSVKITTPNGAVVGPIARGSDNGGYPGQSTPDGLVYLANGADTTATGDFEVYIEVSRNSLQNMDGTWRFTFIPAAPPGAANGEVDLWRFASGNVTGASFVQGNQPTEELISEPGNAAELITVGAWVTKRQWTDCNNLVINFSGTPTVGSLASFSSPGPTRDGRQKPDITAPGAVIGSATTFDISQSCAPGGSLRLPDGLNHTINQGTSMAAPHVSGAVALLLQAFGAETPAQIKTRLFAQANTSGAGAVPNKDWGYGKLHLDNSVGTLLSLFQASLTPEGVELRWQLGDPGEFSAVALERSETQDGPWSAPSAELREEGGFTVALDRGAASGRTYYYRLNATLRSGAVMIFGPLSVTAGASIPDFALLPVKPNPTRGVTRIDFTVAREARVRLSLFDVEGREVAVLAEGPYRPGHYQAAWNGTRGGEMAPPGLYFVRYRTPGVDRVRRVVVAR